MATLVDDERQLTAELAKSKGLLDEVDNDKYYNLVIQLGSRIRWKGFSGGAWVRDMEKDNPQLKTIGYRHIPAIHEVEQVAGTNVNGIIARHNRWLAFNAEGDQNKGDVGKQFLVLEVEECKAPNYIGNRITVETIEQIAQAAAKGVAEAFSAAPSQPSGSPRRSSSKGD